MNHVQKVFFSFILAAYAMSLPLQAMQNCDQHVNFKNPDPATTYSLPSEDQIKERLAAPEFAPLLECSDLLPDLADQELDVASVLWHLHLLIEQVTSDAKTRRELLTLLCFREFYRNNVHSIAATLLADEPRARLELARLIAEAEGRLADKHQPEFVGTPVFC